MVAPADGTFAKEGLTSWMLSYLTFFYGIEGEDCREHDRRVIEHPDGGGFLLSELEPRGIKGFTILPNLHMLFRINNKKEVFAYSDMKGWKVNSSVGIANLATESIGGVGVDISGQELLVAYEQGIIDSVTMSPDSIYAYGLGETNKYGLIYWAVVNHMAPCMNLDLWNSLSPELQDIIENKVIPEVEDWTWEYIAQAEWGAIDKLREENGMIIHEQPMEERLEMQEKLIVSPSAQPYIGMINPTYLWTVDALRTEPYDVAPHFPKPESN
jgi:TRAP-type C4-dicarboxylate transport system substrate-binding protein